MPNGLYWQTYRGKTGNWSIERIHCEKTDSNGKPDFSVVYATWIEFLRTTALLRAFSLKIPRKIQDPKPTTLPKYP